jgi:hypothetical protein
MTMNRTVLASPFPLQLIRDHSMMTNGGAFWPIFGTRKHGLRLGDQNPASPAALSPRI